MDLTFTLSGNIDPVALYAAILSTATVLIGGFQWWARNRITIVCSGNMLVTTDPERKRHILITVVNKGVSATTITGLSFYYWENWFSRIFRKKHVQAFFVPAAKTPHVLSPGEEWKELVPQGGDKGRHQDLSLEEMAQKGVLYAAVFHSMGNPLGVLCRIKIPDTK